MPGGHHQSSGPPSSTERVTPGARRAEAHSGVAQVTASATPRPGPRAEPGEPRLPVEGPPSRTSPLVDGRRRPADRPPRRAPGTAPRHRLARPPAQRAPDEPRLPHERLLGRPGGVRPLARTAELRQADVDPTARTGRRHGVGHAVGQPAPQPVPPLVGDRRGGRFPQEFHDPGTGHAARPCRRSTTGASAASGPDPPPARTNGAGRKQRGARCAPCGVVGVPVRSEQAAQPDDGPPGRPDEEVAVDRLGVQFAGTRVVGGHDEGGHAAAEGLDQGVGGPGLVVPGSPRPVARRTSASDASVWLGRPMTRSTRVFSSREPRSVARTRTLGPR